MIGGKRVGASKVEVLPGRHELFIIHYIINLLGYPPECKWAGLNFEAGHEYKIKAPFKSDLVEIIDVNTGAIIFSEIWSGCSYVGRK